MVVVHVCGMLGLLVPLEVVLRREVIAARRTRIRMLALVCTDVPLEIAEMRKLLTTNVAGVRSLASVGQHVSSDEARKQERHVTLLTLVGLDAWRLNSC